MKKLGIMQPYLFPYIGYYQLLNAVDEYVIYDDVQYIKGGWINRNNILMGREKVTFTIILDNASPNKNINEINIKDNFDKFLKTVSMAYSRAPNRDEVLALLEKICGYNDKNLAQFTGNALKEVADYLGIGTALIYSSSLSKDSQLPAQEKVISICKVAGADTYINSIGGKELYEKDAFITEGIELKFLKTKDFSYKQFGKEFIPNLSIIDVMMFNTRTNIQELLKLYELE